MNFDPSKLLIRMAASDDGPFLEQMLAVASDWNRVVSRPVSELLSNPSSAHYIVGWKRDTDEGVVAEEASRPIGAAWWRYFPADDPGHGFVSVDVPEVSVGVVAVARDRGVGERLLRSLIDHAQECGVPSLSPSGDPENYALRLYRRLGFEEVGHVGGSLTMIRKLG